MELAMLEVEVDMKQLPLVNLSERQVRYVQLAITGGHRGRVFLRGGKHARPAFPDTATTITNEADSPGSSETRTRAKEKETERKTQRIKVFARLTRYPYPVFGMES